MKRRIRLTESDLHRIVKRTVNKLLKESENADRYVAININYRLTQDIYDEGETNNESYWNNPGETIEGNSIKELIYKVAEEKDFDIKEVGILDDMVVMQCMTDENTSRMTPQEHDDWKKGEFDAYVYEVTFSVVKQTPLSHEELVSNGFENWG